ncbi:MAG: hypothetical protein DWQ42_14190 [Planctomycetota bacterium]|nr:MAG: hypothetical protein DWQ42_14190 [Planctomycetota bacterium]REK45963.1 MAG: hypothetical protein DWQ46_07780 [Planctomycetota bacterium]
MWLSVRSPDELELPLYLEAKIDYDPFMDDLVFPGDIDDDAGCDAHQQAIEEDARTYLSKVIETLRNRQFREYERLVFAPWEDRPRWGMMPADEPPIRRIIKDERYSILSQANEFKFFMGRFCLLAYTGYAERELGEMDGYEGYYSFVFRDSEGEEERHYVNAIRLIRVDGRWEFWK